MINILHYLKDPKLWESWYIPYCGAMQDLYHQPEGLKVKQFIRVPLGIPKTVLERGGHFRVFFRIMIRVSGCRYIYG